MSSRPRNRTMKTGDRFPNMEITLNFDTTGSSAIRVIGTRGGAKVCDKTPTVTHPTATTSLLSVTWDAAPDDAFLDAEGPVEFEVEVMYAGTKPLTVNPSNLLVVSADAD